MIYEIKPFESAYSPVSSGGMAAMEQRVGLVGARRDDGAQSFTQGSGEGGSPVFWTNLVFESGVAKCTVSDGYVIDHLVGTNPPQAYYLPAGMSAAGVRHRFGPVAAGQQISVVVTVTADGVVDAMTPPAIAIETVNPASVHYQPEVDVNLGVAGAYHYKLAWFTGSPLTMIRVMAGSHIDHFQELPKMLSAGGTASVPKQWDDAARAYKLRGITADASDNGQLNVAVSGDDNEILIRGNSVDGSITYTPYGGSPTTVAEWLDGLMTTVGGDIPLPDSGGGDPSTHPWKVTSNDDGTVAIEAGVILGFYLTYSAASPSGPPTTSGMFGPDNIVVGPGGSYNGSAAVAVTSGTKYIYAVVSRNGPLNEYCETLPEYPRSVTTELYDDIDPDIADVASIVVSATAPDTYVTATSYVAAVCIAKVTNTADIIAIDNQYVTYNPILFLPIVGGHSDLSIP